MGLLFARAALVLLGLAGAGVAVTVAPRDRLPSFPIPATSAPTIAPHIPPRNLDSLGAVVVEHNAFRLHRTPSSASYDPQRAHTDPGPPPRPAFTVTGIIWARSPTALVEGFPGIRTAQLVSPGDTVGGFVVASITASEVRLVGADTTWTLTVKER